MKRKQKVTIIGNGCPMPLMIITTRPNYTENDEFMKEYKKTMRKENANRERMQEKRTKASKRHKKVH